MDSLFVIIILVVFIFNILQIKKKVLGPVKKGFIIGLLVLSGILLAGVMILTLQHMMVGGLELLSLLILTIIPTILLLTSKDK